MARSFVFNPLSGNFDIIDIATAGANTTLSNLGTTAINSSLIFNMTTPIIQSSNGTTSQGISLKSGNASAGASGDITIATGTATTSRGILILDSSGAQFRSSIAFNANNTYSIGSGSEQVFIYYGQNFLGYSGTTTFGSAFTGNIPVVVQSGSNNLSSINTNTLTLQSGDQITSGTGTVGTVTLRSGNISVASNTNPTGNVVLSSGTTTGSGATGDILIHSGTTTGAGNTGRIEIVSANTANQSGEVYISTGDGDTLSSQLSLFTGNAVSGVSGDVYIYTGNSTNANSGSILLQTGTSGSTKGVIDMTQSKSISVVWESGATGARPSTPVLGQRYFDTSLASGAGKPIWYNNTNWVDATGTTV